MPVARVLRSEDFMRSTQWRGVLCFGVLWMTSGCITDATTELTSAPTDAISDLTNGTSAAVSDLTEPITNFTSSTTPGAADGHNPAWARKRLQNFTKASHDNSVRTFPSATANILCRWRPWP